MGAAEDQHAQTGLSDTAADGERKLPVEQLFVEIQFPAVVAAGFSQLTVKGFRPFRSQSS